MESEAGETLDFVHPRDFDKTGVPSLALSLPPSLPPSLPTSSLLPLSLAPLLTLSRTLSLPRLSLHQESAPTSARFKFCSSPCTTSRSRTGTSASWLRATCSRNSVTHNASCRKNSHGIGTLTESNWNQYIGRWQKNMCHGVVLKTYLYIFVFHIFDFLSRTAVS